ncbi:MAG: DUF58 domain-containing protein [Nannocystaceae bacterium]
MRLIPSLRLVALLVIPAIMSVAIAAERSLIWPVVAVDLMLVVAALADALLARRPLISIRRHAADVMSIGRVNVVTLEVRSRARRRLRARVTFDLFDHAQSPDLPLELVLAAGERRSVDVRLIPQRRGRYALGDHWVRYPSPLGLWHRQLRLRERHGVRVYPDVHSVRDYELLARRDRAHALGKSSRQIGGENEFEALREYNRDDEFRSIDWRATARRSKLIARQYQLERDQSVFFALDSGRLMTAEADGIALFDRALNATLMLAHVASRGGDHVGMMTFDQKVHTFLPPAPGRKGSLRLIQALFDLHPALVETDYTAAFRQLAPRLRKRTMVVIFTQVVDQVAATRLIHLCRGLHPRHLALCVLFRDPEVETLVRVPEAALDPRRPEPYIAAAAAELLGWRDHVIRTLRQSGAHVLDVLPTELSPAVINRYLEIKARHLL